MAKKLKPIALILLILLLTGCAAGSSTKSSLVESPNCSYRVLERIFFGFNTPKGVVTDKQWHSFLAKHVTPRFPAGFTVVTGRGQWMGNNKKIVYETSRILEIVHDDYPDYVKTIEEITAKYKKMYQQEAVLVLKSRVLACL